MGQYFTNYKYILTFLFTTSLILLADTGWCLRKTSTQAEFKPVFFEPANNASDIFPGKAFLQIGFDENIQTKDAAIKIFEAKSDKLISSTSLADSIQVQVKGKVLYIKPTVLLKAQTTYYINIDSDGIVNVDKTKSFKGINDKTAWTFTTTQDTRAPFFTNVLPIVQETSFNDFTFEFDVSEPVNVFYKLLEVGKKAPTSETLTKTGKKVNYQQGKNKVTIDKLIAGKRYDLYLIAQDLAGNASPVWQETIQLQVNLKYAIALEFAKPLNGKHDISINTEFEMYFSEAVKAGNGMIKIYDAQSYTLKESIDIHTCDIKGIKLSFKPMHPLDTLTDYFIKIDSGALISINNKKKFSGINSSSDWHFTTNNGNDNQPPKFTKNTPTLLNNSSNEIELQIALNELAMVYYMAIPKGENISLPTAQQVIEAKSFDNQSAPISGKINIQSTELIYPIKIEKLKENTSYRIFLLAVDKDGNHKKYPYEIAWFQTGFSELSGNHPIIQN
ncbi:Ig-like domain-containing protein [Chondrinema litorale]|uniref:Ig-like domain-containing protein n=1 Tax=Chondrinema litorale TaxID=2994555 RepID=UPI00254367DA|nr:Ig-like domain-containing protein [Chondrinema litorale]UZR92663.1 Ig-like domain-containing protein [Chondrinema litorale]